MLFGSMRDGSEAERTKIDDAGGILVVDDVADNVRVLAGLLEERGYRVRPVTSGRAALRAVESEPPALILLDINMPELDGYDVCATLAAHAEHRRIPVIFVSAMSEPFDKVRAFRLGAVDYVTKPFQFDEVCARVDAHLSLRRLRNDLEERNLNLEDTNKKLRETEAMRDSLTNMLVHDLRSPLAGVIASLELLSEELAPQLSRTHSEDIGLALQASRKLVDMVSSILDVSRLESRKFPLDKRPHDLSTIVEDALSTLGRLSKRLSIRFDRPTTPELVSCDRNVIVRVISNLTANAITHTPSDGDITLSVRRDGRRTVVRIKDTGPGIAPEHQQRIFDKFSQLEGGRRRPYSSGLGLTFCKLAIEAHGGSIGVESMPGAGAVFWFALDAE